MHRQGNTNQRKISKCSRGGREAGCVQDDGRDKGLLKGFPKNGNSHKTKKSRREVRPHSRERSKGHIVKKGGPLTSAASQRSGVPHPEQQEKKKKKKVRAIERDQRGEERRGGGGRNAQYFPGKRGKENSWAPSTKKKWVGKDHSWGRSKGASFVARKKGETLFGGTHQRKRKTYSHKRKK